MKTVLAKVDEQAIRSAGEIIRQGGLVAFPTETVYGLGANAFDEKAVLSIFAAKGRPADNPLIVHIADKSGFEGIVKEIPEKAQKLIDRFMPGPLTVILKKTDKFSIIGVSVCGAIAHNLAQICVAIFLFNELKIAFYFPVLLICGTVTGILIGTASLATVKLLPKKNKS